MTCLDFCARSSARSYFRLFALGLLMGLAGCSGGAIEDVESDSQGPQLGIATQAERTCSRCVWVEVEDPRTITSSVFFLEGTDPVTGQFYWDWQALDGSLPGEDEGWAKYYDMYWDINASWKPNILYGGRGFQDLYSRHSSARIVDYTQNSNFSTMYVAVQAYINGVCHEDWEEVSWLDEETVYFDGRNATWNGSCWVGDLLHHH